MILPVVRDFYAGVFLGRRADLVRIAELMSDGDFDIGKCQQLYVGVSEKLGDTLDL